MASLAGGRLGAAGRGLRAVVWEEIGGGAGLLSAMRNQNCTHEGHPTVAASSKETRLRFGLLGVTLCTRWGLQGWAVSHLPPAQTQPEAS